MVVGMTAQRETVKKKIKGSRWSSRGGATKMLAREEY